MRFPPCLTIDTSPFTQCTIAFVDFAASDSTWTWAVNDEDNTEADRGGRLRARRTTDQKPPGADAHVESMDGFIPIHPWICPLRPARATAPSRPKRECNPPPEPRFAAAVFRQFSARGRVYFRAKLAQFRAAECTGNLAQNHSQIIHKSFTCFGPRKAENGQSFTFHVNDL